MVKETETRPIVDYSVFLCLQTPSGLIVRLPIDHVEIEQARALVSKGPDGDFGAAQLMARLTGLRCTVQRMTQTTCEGIEPR